MPEFQVKQELIRIAETDYLIESLLNRQQYSDPTGAAEDRGISSAMWPIFGLVWPSGIAMAKIISELSLENQTMLEVGCGIGLASLVAINRGANITANDYHPLTESFLKANCQLNNLSSINYLDGDWKKPIVQEGRFNLIFGSDLLYEREGPEILSQYIHAHATSDALIIIVDPGRKLINKFSRLMEEKGYHCVIEKLPPPTLDGKKYKGKSYTYQQIAG